MNILHLKALCEIVDQGLHLSNAAHALHRSQPALTRQIQQLEEELGVTLFERNRNRLISLTEQGEAVVRIARRMMSDADDIASVARDKLDPDTGELRVATTHTQARYMLPAIIRKFKSRYPAVNLSLLQGTPAQCCDLVARGAADIGICTEIAERQDVVQLPCYRLQRVVVTPPRHPLLRVKPLTLDALSRYPVITYAEGFSGRSVFDRTFREAGLTPTVVMSAIDADVSKAYVEMGMGIAILARVAFEPARDKQLRCIDASHLFTSSNLNVVVRPNAYVRGFTLDFIQLFAPALSAGDIQLAVASAGIAVPRRELPAI